ncbi:hypothetical protein E2C01_060224 [Portunus trituberculatus]|uniref:Uncharacterized protein n=1 Tax=Portunus trituberculatus TaxID=210409 RepID=A0A5B7H0E4_PORTR|nr:hypothetical protein [Portunus trituberculatus]
MQDIHTIRPRNIQPDFRHRFPEYPEDQQR